MSGEHVHVPRALADIVELWTFQTNLCDLFALPDRPAAWRAFADAGGIRERFPLRFSR